ncbi:acid phosphatase [Alteromonas macleodii str. 'Black Sea 11']|uniref:HAD family acid phosphatase n=1 Tax=Alteromonas abrolhosensis TaxID=1892904 RepID=UPI000286F481|nr:acid phosphatase [Alteromonas macleodii str. 'Black Sea 11']NKW89077.1 acid phosphatase [Alteromonadaceae bacterium A_SAG4]NKX03957.1 acid phosphatase [Alteromonadaceae bacterium A_SAG6]NKX18612.1 acid phosphatase [Alteromonadaceae bacterium A_SAG5]NKX34787.1 acid phosphatase [Alteromonadaceae bacterium A_SAG3]
MLSLNKLSDISKVVCICAAVSTIAACSSTASTPLAGEKTHTLSNAVVYQTSSKEYPVLSSFVYNQAIAALPTRFADGDVVVMDVDETVLDNSTYQQERESVGLGYSSKSWADWVKREEATLVPGVAAFLDEVVARNGKVALITNRDKTLDSHTWNNLLAQGLPLTTSNTCVVGRTTEDKEAVGQEGMVNDKDLRRMQLTQGKIACSNTSDDTASTWGAPHTIIMQIGDNIEDVGGVTQESANVQSLMPRVGTEIFILPNPMYGSW